MMLPFVNADKMAVTGVSYGGYIASMMLAERHSDLLACGVAVSPVVDWRFYGIATICLWRPPPRISRFMAVCLNESSFFFEEQNGSSIKIVQQPASAFRIYI